MLSAPEPELVVPKEKPAAVAAGKGASGAPAAASRARAAGEPYDKAAEADLFKAVTVTEGMEEDDLMELDKGSTVVLLKFMLQMGYSMREVQSGIMNVFLGNAENPLLNALRNTGQWYSQQVNGKPGHGLGPPLPHVFVTMLKYCAKKAVASKAELDHIKKFLEDWEHKEAEQKAVHTEIFDMCPILRVAKAFTPKGEPQNFKLLIRCVDTKLKKALFSTFEDSGLERKLGMAPRGALERILQGKLDHMIRKKK